MNQNRIRKALDHIQTLINHAEAGRLERDDVQNAREGWAYLSHVLEALSDVEKPVGSLMDASESISRFVTELERAIDSEPKHPGMSLGL